MLGKTKFPFLLRLFLDKRFSSTLVGKATNLLHFFLKFFLLLLVSWLCFLNFKVSFFAALKAKTSPRAFGQQSPLKSLRNRKKKRMCAESKAINPYLCTYFCTYFPSHTKTIKTLIDNEKTSQIENKAPFSKKALM